MVSTHEAYYGIIPVFLIAVFNWIYSIFILNRFRGFLDFSKAELIALSLYLLGGYASWVAEMCILDDDLIALQIVSSLYRTFCNWIGFVLIVNERLALTMQQLGSLVFVMIIASLWEVQHRVMLNSSEDEIEYS